MKDHPYMQKITKQYCNLCAAKRSSFTLTKVWIFGDVLNEDNNINKHFALYFSLTGKTTSQWYLFDIYSPMRQKMGYWEGEAKIVNHIWIIFLYFFKTNIWFFALTEDNSVEYGKVASSPALLLELRD